jgi:hypothetical protein
LFSAWGQQQGSNPQAWDDEACGQPLCCNCWHYVSNFFLLSFFASHVSGTTKVANHSAATVGIMLLTFSIAIVYLLGPSAGLEPSTLG